MKQDKIINKINAKSGTSENLAVAKKAKFDEFYTPQDDIKNELKHWKHKFIGKRIICPCDWDVFADEDVYSVTIEFGEENLTPTYTINKVQRVKVTRYIYNTVEGVNENMVEEALPEIKEEIITGDKARELLKTRVTCNFVRYLLGIANECKIKSITASGYDGINKRGVKFQDIDYSQYDLCLTNPPFSLYKEFMDYMIAEYDRRDRETNPFDFIVLAPLINRQVANVARPLTERKIFLGYNRDTHIAFRNPDEQATHDRNKTVDIDWLTTFDDAQKEIDECLLNTGVDYNIYKDEYTEMLGMTLKDGTHPIRIKDKRAIPENYGGWMFCSVGVLNKLSYKYYDWCITSLFKYYNKDYPEKNPLNHPFNNDMYLGGFHGVLFRRKPETLTADESLVMPSQTNISSEEAQQLYGDLWQNVNNN